MARRRKARRALSPFGALEALLFAVVTRLAKGLERTSPEARLVAAMALDVVADRGGRRIALCFAQPAKRLLSQLPKAQLAPTRRVVKLAPWVRGPALPVMLALASHALQHPRRRLKRRRGRQGLGVQSFQGFGE